MGGPTQGELTTREVAAALGVAERTVLSYVARGKIESRTEWRGLRREHFFSTDVVERMREIITRTREESR